MTELQQGLSLFVVGVAAVFIALIITALVISLIGRLAREKPPIPAAEAGPLPDVAYSGIDKHVVVLLAAAATVAVKRPVRIRRVRFISHRHAPSGWAAAGRTEHTDSS
uniref:Na+-transporting methylmalonyl-CoA/oxaloacetate decarboxylase, gamma subunit n=1 Tax=Candidatus Kentrum eta TaxID=2126337 RepID=A0A450V4V2_9GAMM|nr:MAG: Na+-transporting methylmalonyl-CoA/oxaloacetate decarboxylase, gamma subunit [Candidatus Kentron sp. H]VFK00265.1 MAG: Na+-transporting methylmalonyl-CoA/oxaloacetate decarboxylase, gamma subunit [Candidatus Kentron sp. H]VFK04211.1 MAG: Na+-transporting methylmalonyl-CoA/oxaloacetate decarboxylase, gamma subunit [Candidatus Kentron sp. H]